jgi:hypothetical protein
MKKKLPTEAITSELAQSVFFQRPAVDQPDEPVVKPVQDKPAKPHSPTQARRSPPPSPGGEEPKTSHQPWHEASNDEVKPDVKHDVMTSQFQDIDLRTWQEIIEDTETQNSALRLTNEERYAIEDAVNELRRKYGIKTSMNEIARLGMLLLIHDFKQHKKQSMIHKVKKA